MSLFRFFRLFKVKDNKERNRGKEPVFRYSKKNETRFVNYLPWDYFIPDSLYIDSETTLETCIVVQKDGSIQQTYGFRGHDIESFSADYINVVFEYFNSQIKRLTDGWMVSVEAQRFRMNDYPDTVFKNLCGFIVDKEREENFRDSGTHYDSNYYLTFVYKPENEIKKKTTKFFVSEPVQAALIDDSISYFKKTVENMVSVLSSRLIIRPLDVSETICFLHSTCSTKRHDIRVPKHFMFLDYFICDQKLDIANTLRLGEEYIPIVEVYDFPTETYPAILNDINKLDIEYRWVSRFFPIGKEEGLKEISKYQADAASGKKSGKSKAAEMMFDVESPIQNFASSAAQSDAETAQAEIGGDINGLGYYQSSVMVWDEDYFLAMEKVKKVISCINNCGFTAKEEEYGAFDAFLGMCAGNTTGNVRRPLITTGNFSHCLPFSAIWAGMEHNKFLGDLTGVDKPLVICSTNYGSQFYLNLNDGDVGHTLILGPTGAGKSTLLNLIAVSGLKYPDIQIFILDYGLSALTLTLGVGGTYINPSDSTVCFQPLRDIDDKNEFIWACDFIKTLLMVQGVPEEPGIDVAIEAAMESLVVLPKEMRTITNFCLNLEYSKDGEKILDAALTPYTIRGRFGHIFDGDRVSLSSSKWVLFEMEGLMNYGKECSGPSLLYIFHYLEKNFTGRLTFLIMDECWFGLESDAIRPKMKEYLLTLRKKNVFCIFATQNPSAIANSELCTTMIQNCPTKIFLSDPKAHELQEDYEKLSLSREEIHILSMSRKKRDYYYTSTLGTRLFQLELGPLELALFRERETNFKGPDGKIRKWADFQKYLLSKRETPKGRRLMFDLILEAQNIDFEKYLSDIPWKDFMYV